jgi:hypothetical protein
MTVPQFSRSMNTITVDLDLLKALRSDDPAVSE